MKKILKRISYHIESLLTRLLWLKYRKKPYVEFYKAVMKLRSKLNLAEATGSGDWDFAAAHQLKRLKGYGLKPHNTLFELGCGQLRGGRLAIAYLNADKYCGNDISPEILNRAKEVIKTEKLEGKNAQLYLTTNLEFNEVNGRTFDFIHAQSVLSHMPPEDIQILFKNVKKIMHKESCFLASFFLSKDGTIYPFANMKNFAFPKEWLEAEAKKKGFHIEFSELERKQKLMCLSLAKQD